MVLTSHRRAGRKTEDGERRGKKRVLCPHVRVFFSVTAELGVKRSRALGGGRRSGIRWFLQLTAELGVNGAWGLSWEEARPLSTCSSILFNHCRPGRKTYHRAGGRARERLKTVLTTHRQAGRKAKHGAGVTARGGAKLGGKRIFPADRRAGRTLKQRAGVTMRGGRQAGL